MAERWPGLRDVAPDRPPCTQERIHRGLAQRDDNLEVLKEAQLPFEKRLASRELRSRRKISRRDAPHGGRDDAIMEDEAITARDGRRLVREARAMEGAVQPCTAPVACEHSSRAVPAMGRGREPDDEETSLRVAERRDWTAPVRLVRERAPLLPCNALSPLDKAGTPATRDDFARDRIKAIVVVSPLHRGPHQEAYAGPTLNVIQKP